MTESEIAKAQLPPQIANQANRPQQQSTMPPQQQQRHSQNASNTTNVHTTLPPSPTVQSQFLLQPGAHFDPKADAPVPFGQITNWESNYQNMVEKYAKMSQDDMIESISNGNLDVKFGNGKALSDGLLCGILVEPASSAKYFACLAVISEADNWQTLLTSINMLISEFYSHLRQHCRQQLLYIFEQAMKLNIRQLDSVFCYFCRALSDGTEFRETFKTAQNFAQLFLANKEWILKSLPTRSILPSVAFALFSRLIADAQNMAPNGGNGETSMTNVDNFRQPLISVCELLIRHRFADLMLMGRDLVLTLMRLAKITPFIAVWRSLLHHPAELMPKLTGIQQLLVQSPVGNILHFRVSLRISRKMDEIVKNQCKIFTAGRPHLDAGIGKAQQQQIHQETARLFELLKTIHLSGPDSGSIRAEIIRHVWAMLSHKEFNPASIDGRSTLLSWLLKSAKAGAEAQWCKLVFFWEWYGFDPSPAHAFITADPVFSTIRHLLNKDQIQLCNSLVDFLIKSVQMMYPPLMYFFATSVTNAIKTLEMVNMQTISFFNHTKMDPQLREQMRQTFPDLFPKRATPIDLVEPSAIIDFDAIRGNAPAESNFVPETPIAQQPNIANGRGGPATTKAIKIEQQSPKLDVKTSTNDAKLQTATTTTTEKGGNDGQPAMKKAKLMSADSLPSTHLKKKIVKKESQPDIIDAMINREMDEHAKKRKRIKSNEGKGGGGKALKSSSNTSQQITSKTTLPPPMPSASSTPTIPPQPQQPMPSTSTCGQLQIVDENDEIVDDSEPEESSANRQMPLSLLLPMVREEFREPLESLERSMKQCQAGKEQEAMTAMQNLLDAIFDADEIDNEQREFIAICLVRIFDVYLHQKSYMPEDQSEDNLDNAIEHPLYRFFKVLCQSADDSESRRTLLAIAMKMRTECPRLGYLYLFFTAIVGREDGLGRGDSGPSTEQMENTYKAICEMMEEDWTKQMAMDLEQCHLDERDLFACVLLGILKQWLANGPPEKIIHTICICADPRMIAKLSGEIVRENIVLFGAVNVPQLLTDSLKWNSFEQFTLWQLIQIEAVEFVKFLEILPRLNYSQHPEATTAITVILRNMEPNPETKVMKDLLRNLLLRPHQRDLFTGDAIKLILDYEDNIPSVADCIGRMVKKATNQGDIMDTTGGQTKGKPSRVLTVENIFGHLDRLCRHSCGKDSQSVEKLLKHILFLDMVSMVRKNTKLNELRTRFDELFTQFDIHSEDSDKPSSKGPKSKHGRNAAAVAKTSIKLSSNTSVPGWNAEKEETGQNGR